MLTAFLGLSEARSISSHSSGKALHVGNVVAPHSVEPNLLNRSFQEMTDNPMKEGSKTHAIIMNTRKRKGLKIELPVFENYYDKL